MPRMTVAVAMLAVALVAGLLLNSASTAADAKKDAEAIQGTWIVLSIENNGLKSELGDEKDEAKQFTLKFSGDQVTIKYGDLEAPEEKASFKLDPGAKPKSMDTVRTKDGKVLTTKAIYELDGDQLRICSAKSDKDDRPAVFTGAKDKGTILMTLKRKK